MIVTTAANMDIADCELINHRKTTSKKKTLSKSSIYAKYVKTPLPEISLHNSSALSNHLANQKSNTTTPII